MDEAVKSLLRSGAPLRPGDVFLSNDPNAGGSHLPDLTVITPVFGRAGEGLLFFTASRAHHAEIGGLRPGSTYPFAKNLAEEGVVLRNLKVVAGGRFLEEDLLAALTAGPYPSRSPRENVADVRAAIAANHAGAEQLLATIDAKGAEAVGAYMGHIRDAAREKAAAAIGRLGEGEYTFEDCLDDGSPVRIALRVRGGRLTVDFTGSGEVRGDCLNANRAVVQSCLLYCLRCLVDEDIPLNAGALAVLELVLPEGMLNPPRHERPQECAAVVGGNVELSQRIVDVFLGALGVLAASQGTMNNLVFGNEQMGYYETICGGTGAGPGFDGAHAVHSHMTNTRITDVEILEQRFGVRLLEFAVRRGSGGRGRHRGGDGVVRRIEFLAPLSVSLLTQRRLKAPFGLAGGASGLPGCNLLLRAADSHDEQLPPMAQFDVAPGDVLTIITPGGGGYGREGG
jgi:5-oxoprolinase (ATP-hydrolysing)